ncbi:MAG: polysaccharide lyase [Cyanobacteria bacterium P01_H01_bin.105]
MFKSIGLLMVLALISCQTDPSGSISTSESVAANTSSDFNRKNPDDTPPDDALLEGKTVIPLWTSKLDQSDWINTWEPRDGKSWGFNNLEILSSADGPFETVLRVHYPASSASPSVSRQAESPLGGAQFYADLFLPAQTQMSLTYYLRFAEGFDFVKGGKLPGLFGGVGASGGTIPNGTDGFSARLMWRHDGQGEVYAYLPTSETYGTSIERGAWRFQPGIWYKLKQEIKLNTPDQADGEIRLWVNDTLVIEQKELMFRTVDSLQIDGIFFSTFFGGGDVSWATPQDTYIDFADFSIAVD